MAQAQNTRTFGATIGAALGTSAAYAVHGALTAAQYTGRFGQDMAAGAADAYGVKSAELEAKRAAVAASRNAFSVDDVVAPPAAAHQRKVKTA